MAGGTAGVMGQARVPGVLVEQNQTWRWRRKGRDGRGIWREQRYVAVSEQGRRDIRDSEVGAPLVLASQHFLARFILVQRNRKSSRYMLALVTPGPYLSQ